MFEPLIGGKQDADNSGLASYQRFISLLVPPFSVSLRPPRPGYHPPCTPAATAPSSATVTRPTPRKAAAGPSECIAGLEFILHNSSFILSPALSPIFRDEDELAANADLATCIRAALEMNDQLIVELNPSVGQDCEK